MKMEYTPHCSRDPSHKQTIMCGNIKFKWKYLGKFHCRNSESINLKGLRMEYYPSSRNTTVKPLQVIRLWTMFSIWIMFSKWLNPPHQGDEAVSCTKVAKFSYFKFSYFKLHYKIKQLTCMLSLKTSLVTIAFFSIRIRWCKGEKLIFNFSILQGILHGPPLISHNTIY
jgi:hypothetical protein